jgi:hypothetical protein
MRTASEGVSESVRVVSPLHPPTHRDYLIKEKVLATSMKNVSIVK